MYNYFEVKISSHRLVNCSVKEDCSLKEAKGKIHEMWKPIHREN